MICTLCPRNCKAERAEETGAGVCRIGERAVFVPGTIVGEEWDVRIVRSTSAAV